MGGIENVSIRALQAREILDSRGLPTIEVDVRLDDGCCGRAAVPAGISTGSREAAELRDGNPARYGGRGTRMAVALIEELIAPALRGLPCDQSAIDQRLIVLDATSDKHRLGANSLLAVSLAVARSLARSRGLPLYAHLATAMASATATPAAGATTTVRQLPVPMFNILNGGAHAGNTVDLEEFMIAPVGADSFAEALRMGAEVYHALKALLKRAGKVTAVGDEGGFAPDLNAEVEAIELLLGAIEHAGFRPGSDFVLALDAAASALYDHGTYVFRKSLRHRRSSEQMIRRYEDWVRRYPLWSIEDGLADGDTEGWRALCATLGERVQLVGDDLFVTNAVLIRAGVANGIANAVLIKLNQVGTVSETLAAIGEARAGGYGIVVSHRSGETTDDFIADLAVAVGAGQIKSGAPARGERVAKYNQLLRIEQALGTAATYAGPAFARRGGFPEIGGPPALGTSGGAGLGAAGSQP